MPTQIVFSSHNQHKAEEISAILGPDFEIVTLAALGLHDDVAETADTFEGNALIKAQYAAAHTSLPCFADDSGLEVDALGGAPGIHTARFAGEQCNSADNIAKLLHLLEGQQNRAARFRTVIAFIDGGEVHYFHGTVDGTIATECHGAEGFGYDPIFVPNEANGRTFAEMASEEKNAISHRARALAQLKKYLSKCE